MNRFSAFHPLVSFCYFVSVLGITMFSVHPILLLLSLLGGIFALCSGKRHSFSGKTIGFYILLFGIITVTNPLFSHHGVTPLFFLNGNPVTLEALLYGMDIALLFLAVICWFQVFQQVMTTDKLLYLLGKVSYSIALLVSSALRLIPLFRVQAEKIRQTQRAMGLFASDTWMDRVRGTVRVYSALITWALENAVDTGDSMKARGYGLRGRSHYSLFCFRKGDGLFLAFLFALDGAIIAVMVRGGFTFSFYPTVQGTPLVGENLLAFVLFLLLSFLPFLIEGKERLQWNYYRSKI